MHNIRYIIDKIYMQLRDMDGADNLRQELDRIDQLKGGINDRNLADVLIDVAQFYPDVYASVPEAAAYVVHMKGVQNGDGS